MNLKCNVILPMNRERLQANTVFDSESLTPATLQLLTEHLEAFPGQIGFIIAHNLP